MVDKESRSSLDAAIAREVSLLPCTHSVACCFGNPSIQGSLVNSGTISLVSYGDRRAGITNAHVVEGFRRRQMDEPDLRFYVGNAMVDVESIIISTGSEVDICTLSLDDVPLDRLRPGGSVGSEFLPFDSGQMPGVAVDDFIAFGGYPGDWRQQPESNHLVFDTFSVGGTEATGVNERLIYCSLDLQNMIMSQAENRAEPPQHFGGLSGGPAMKIDISPSGFVTFPIVGVICNYSEMIRSIVIQRIDCITNEFVVEA